ncbi:12775_t:CDS:2, partial [Acaulospora colombiana]
MKKQVEWLKRSLFEIVKIRREEIERTPEDESLVPDWLTMFLTLNTPRSVTKGVVSDLNSQPLTDGEIVPSLIETSRIFPTLPILFKRNEKPDEIGGYMFPESTEFFAYIEGIHKRKSNWVNPEVFNPDRFVDELHPDYKRVVYTFGGPGRNLALLEMKATLAMIYEKYNLELADVNTSLKFHTGL